jgi:hypothetical protein
MNRKALDELKQQIPLLDYLHAHDWQPARSIRGGRLMGLCPLHTDHKPSFLVNPGQNLFYCYGCARGGDVIRFAELYHQVKFPQAVALLREWCGVTPLLEEVTNFYRMQLSRHREAVTYLEQRGLHAPEVIEHMRMAMRLDAACGHGSISWVIRFRHFAMPALWTPLVAMPIPAASSFRWKTISMAAASWIRRRRTGFCRPAKADCTRGSKSGAPRRSFLRKDCLTTRYCGRQASITSPARWEII